MELWHLALSILVIIIGAVIFIVKFNSKYVADKSDTNNTIKSINEQLKTFKEKEDKRELADKEDNKMLHAIQIQLNTISTTLMERDKANENLAKSNDNLSKVINYITDKEKDKKNA